MVRSNERRSSRPPLESVRQAPFTLVRDSVDSTPGDGLTLDGYGAVFNTLTTIDSWEGRFREKIAPGAMKRSFRETPPKIQFDHGRHPLIGSIPIASLRSATEDVDPVLAPEGGAHIIGRVFDNWLTQPIRDAIASDPPAINGMSFRFTVVPGRESWAYADGTQIRSENDLLKELDRCVFDDVPEEDLPVRTLKELKVPEVGPVAWPAYQETSVSMRSKIIDLGRLNEPSQRRLLAEAVFMADLAESDRSLEDDVLPCEGLGDNKPEIDESSRDAQQDTDIVVERQSKLNDTQQDTDDVVERQSQPRRFSDKQLRLLNQRDRLLTLRSIGERI
jgi:Escherichia/Staphylococcus phage prohead protease